MSKSAHALGERTESVIRAGEEIIRGFTKEFKTANHGRFIAVSIQGKILSIQDTLDALQIDLEKMYQKKTVLPKDYYMARLGYDAITTLNLGLFGATD